MGAGSGEADAVIAITSGTLPDPLPASGMLLVDPDETTIPSTGIINAVRPLTSASRHPLLAGIDLQALLVLRAKKIAAPDWLQTLVESEQGPLLLAGVYQGRRVAVLTFDPADSNLTKLAAFPLLMANLVDWLDPLAGTEALRPGDTLNLTPGSVVVTPSGRQLTVGDSGVFAGTAEAGLYRVRSGLALYDFAVNMADAQESAVAPRDHPELVRQPPVAPPQQLTQQQFWSPLAAVTLVLLAAEWLWYCFRRGTI
jgi:Ca-activated chloride channel family protein